MFAESPRLEHSDTARCLKVDIKRYRDYSRFRVAMNNSGALTTLEYLNDYLLQNVWFSVQVTLPAGSYSILFEKQTLGTYASPSQYIGIDNVQIESGPCNGGKH